MSSNNEAIQTHNIKLDNRDQKIIKLQNDFKDLFYNKEIKKPFGQSTYKRRGTNYTTKRKTNPNTLTRSSGIRTKTADQTRISRKSNGKYRKLFCESCIDYSEKDKSIKIALDSRKLNQVTIKRKAQMSNMEELISRISRKISEGKEGEITNLGRSNWTKIQKTSVYLP